MILTVLGSIVSDVTSTTRRKMTTRIKRDVIKDDDIVWYVLNHGPMAHVRTIHKRHARDTSLPHGEQMVIEYILTNKSLAQVNWDTDDYIGKEDEDNVQGAS